MNARNRLLGWIARHRLLLGGLGVLATLIISSLVVYGKFAQEAGSNGHASGAETAYVSSREFEERYGMQVTLLGVTAAGGMVDFRFRVTDPEKALAVLQNPATHPMLVDLNSGAVVMQEEGMMHHKHFDANKVYYMLFTNPEGKVQPGASVVVQIGDVRLAPREIQ